MKYAHKHLVLAGLLAVFGATAGAQMQSPSATPDQGPRPMAHGGADPARIDQRMARMQERMERFKQKLQLTPSQEGAWNSYLAALKPSGNFHRHDRAEFARLPTPERIDRMRALRTERMAEMDRRGEATKTFYAALSPQQQKVFDDATARRGHRHHRRGGDEHRAEHQPS
jgi:periplasmic protein CpxP/Spy